MEGHAPRHAGKFGFTIRDVEPRQPWRSPSPAVMKPAARENVVFFFSHILNDLQKELGGTLQNFAVSRLAKITCRIFAVSIDERLAMNDNR